MNQASILPPTPQPTPPPLTQPVGGKKRTRQSCPNCRGTEIEVDSAQGNSFCTKCGTLLEENAVVAEVTFAELDNGASVLQGQFISAEKGAGGSLNIFGRREALGSKSSSLGMGSDSAKENGRRRIVALAGAVGLGGSDHVIETATRWYILALQHQFTRGRRGPAVIAACLYIVCRQERTPHMLLDFADVLQMSVYALGGTFLRLVRLLNLEIPLIDPSFFVGRFASKLEFGDRTQVVANTALRLVARMKRDWIQTGRRPAGVCAAGLLIAARMNGFRRTEAEVVSVVRICEATLRRRLEEFAQTSTSQLTPEEFEGIWLEHEADPPSFARTKPKKTEKIAAAGAEGGTLLPPTPLESQARAGEKESLSDLDDDDEIGYVLLDKTESALKTRIWMGMNGDYVKRMEEKEAELASRIESAATEDHPAKADAPEEMAKGGLMAPLGKGRKAYKKRARPAAATQLPVREGVSLAESAAEAAKAVLSSKRFSKKINYEALGELFNPPSSIRTPV